MNQTNWVYGSVVNSLTDGFEQIDDILKAQQVDSILHEIHKLTKDFEEVYDWYRCFWINCERKHVNQLNTGH